MITVKLIRHGGDTVGFDVSGHSGYAESGSDIICAAVSSAVGLVETIINDSLKLSADVTVEPENARVALLVKDADSCKLVLSGFRRHMLALSEEYPKYIEVLEVQSNA
ncbi:MAG: ribosomal-processing cysteine protease Prp [Oscillospiraceae bacterium]|nr:ribosomal-processing cysteine protease Prp [Oscillospiraceae bacterium]